MYIGSLSIKWILTLYVVDLGGQTLQSLLVCDLRCKGQMYVNPNRVFLQRWYGFVKRLMCLNPFKGFSWIHVATPKCWGGKAELCFPHWDIHWLNRQCVHMIFMCWGFVLTVPQANGLEPLPAGSSMLLVSSEWALSRSLCPQSSSSQMKMLFRITLIFVFVLR